MCACEPIESDFHSDFGRLILFYDVETRRKEAKMNVNELGTIYKEVVVKARNAAEAEKTENGRFLVFDAAKKNLEELNNNFMAEHDSISDSSLKNEARRLPTQPPKSRYKAAYRAICRSTVGCFASAISVS